MIEIVGEDGYGAVTVRQLANLAGVSTRAFYVHFEGKEECFLRTYELAVRSAVETIVEARGDERDWAERIRLALAAFAHGVDTEPQAARLALVEAFAAGPAVLGKMQCTESIFETMVSESFALAPDAFEVPPLLFKGIVSGVSHSARSVLLAGGEDKMHELVNDLVGWTLSFHSESATELIALDGHMAAVVSPSERQGQFCQHEVRAQEDERDLILSAVAKLAFSYGYPQLTVPRICSAADVRRRKFDAHFDGVEDCFFAALEARTFMALKRSLACSAGSDSWSGGLYRAIANLCKQIAGDPTFAKLAFVEIFAPGEAGIRCRMSLMEEIADDFCARMPRSQLPCRLAAKASIGAVWGIFHHYVTSGQSHRLPRLAPALAFLALAPAVGARDAVEAIRHELKSIKIEHAEPDFLTIPRRGMILQAVRA